MAFWSLYLDCIGHIGRRAATPNLIQTLGINPHKCILINWLNMPCNIIYRDNLHIYQSKYIAKIDLVNSHFSPFPFYLFFCCNHKILQKLFTHLWAFENICSFSIKANGSFSIASFPMIKADSLSCSFHIIEFTSLFHVFSTYYYDPRLLRNIFICIWQIPITNLWTSYSKLLPKPKVREVIDDYSWH